LANCNNFTPRRTQERKSAEGSGAFESLSLSRARISPQSHNILSNLSGRRRTQQEIAQNINNAFCKPDENESLDALHKIKNISQNDTICFFFHEIFLPL
jgi:hypothetical protein